MAHKPSSGRVPSLFPSAVTLTTPPDHRKAKENVVQWRAAIGTTGAFSTTLHLLLRLGSDVGLRALRLGHSALVVWRPATSEGGAGLGGFHHFFVVLAVLLLEALR